MPVATYLQNKQKKIEAKYHQFLKGLEPKYDFTHRKLISRFYTETTETEVIRSKIYNSILKSTVSIENKINFKGFVSVFSRTSPENINRFYPDIPDWVRGRFFGQTVRMIVREGKIVEKVFLTPKGNRIFVKTSELELWLRSMSTIKIKLRLRLSSMPIMLLKLRPIFVL